MSFSRRFRLDDTHRLEVNEDRGAYFLLAIEEQADRAVELASRKLLSREEAISTLARWYVRWGKCCCVACGSQVVWRQGAPRGMTCVDPCGLEHGRGPEIPIADGPDLERVRSMAEEVTR